MAVLLRLQFFPGFVPPRDGRLHPCCLRSSPRLGQIKVKSVKGRGSSLCSLSVSCCFLPPSTPAPSPFSKSHSLFPWPFSAFRTLEMLSRPCNTNAPSSSLPVITLITASYLQAMLVVLSRLHEKAQLKLSTCQEFCSRNLNFWARYVDDCRFMGDTGRQRGLEYELLEQGGLGMALLSTTAVAKDHISPVMATLCANPTFMSGLVAWVSAQVLKIFTTFFVERRWDFKMLLGSGGMPSSHSALCVALTTSVAICHGISDALFPICLGFTLIVMYDATGVRRHAGMQAEVLNLIVEDLFQGHPISQKKLKELLGHTPLQVGAGAIVGMLAGYLCSQGYSAFPSGNGL